MEGSDEKLDKLWAEYRASCPDPEPAADFMPKLWQRIAEQRSAMAVVFRRLVQVCVGAALVLTVLIAAVVIPRLQKLPVYTATYEDVLAADHPATYVDILNGDIQ
jgi:hypothetical protein